MMAGGTFAGSEGMTTEIRDELIGGILARLFEAPTLAADAAIRAELRGATKRVHAATLRTDTTDGGTHAILMDKCNRRSRALGFIR